MASNRHSRSEKITKQSFTAYYGNDKYYKKILGIHNEYELVFKPCPKGFDIVLYRRQQDNSLRQVGNARSTESGMYYGEDTPRDDVTWEEALRIAQEMIDLRIPKGIER